MKNVFLVIGMDLKTMKVGSIKVFATRKDAETCKQESNDLMTNTDLIYIIEKHNVH